MASTQKDIDFLNEMKQHAIKFFEQKDIVSYQMLIQMIDDWIHELENK